MLAADRTCLDFCDQFWTLSQAGRTERGGTVRWTRSHVTGGRAAGGARPRPVLESTGLPHPWLSTRTLLSLGGHVQMSGDTFGCHSWVGAAGIACAKRGQGWGRHPTMHSTAPATESSRPECPGRGIQTLLSLSRFRCDPQ